MFKELNAESWESTLSRVLISGPPNSRKTTSLVTWPKPIHILSFPGEKGSASIPVGDENIKGYIYEADDPTKYSPQATIREVESLTTEIISGGRGPIATFAGDGLHKLYEVYLEREHKALIDAYPGEDEDKLKGRAYGNAHREFLLYLTKVCHSGVLNVVFTVWDSPDKDDPNDQSKRPSTHVFPDLPGKLARRIMGEFSVVLYAKMGPPLPGGKQNAVWQIQPAGRIWGAGVKIPPHIAAKLPQEVPQDWPKLLPLLQGKATIVKQAPPVKTTVPPKTGDKK